MSVGPHTAAKIQPEGPYCVDGLPHIFGAKSAGQKYRRFHGLDDPPAEAPVVRAPCAALFEDIPWGTAEVLAATRLKAVQLGLRLGETPARHDVDREAMPPVARENPLAFRAFRASAAALSSRRPLKAP